MLPPELLPPYLLLSIGKLSLSYHEDSFWNVSGMVQDMEQSHPPAWVQTELTPRLVSTLRESRGAQGIFKIFIANADDAGASSVTIALDKTKYSTEGLSDPDLGRFQGPALLVYNNVELQGGDWESMAQNLPTKEADKAKVENSGVRHSTVFECADLFTCLSGGRLLLLDPSKEYIPAQSLSFGVADLERQFPGQLAPYRAAAAALDLPEFGAGVAVSGPGPGPGRRSSPGPRPEPGPFLGPAPGPAPGQGLSLGPGPEPGSSPRPGHFPGTLFRFPLRRSEDLAAVSATSSRVWDPPAVDQALREFMGDVPEVLLLTRHVKDVSLAVIDNSHGSLPDPPSALPTVSKALPKTLPQAPLSPSAPDVVSRKRHAGPAAAALLHQSSRSEEEVQPGPVVGGGPTQSRRTVIVSESWGIPGAEGPGGSSPKKQKTLEGGSGEGGSGGETGTLVGDLTGGLVGGLVEGGIGGSEEGKRGEDLGEEFSRSVWSVVGNGKAGVAVLLDSYGQSRRTAGEIS